MTTQDVNRALTVLGQAIHNEITGQQFYNDAAHHCVDPWAKEIFAVLAEEENQHTRLLLLEYEALETQGQWLDLEAALASEAEVDITRFTFLDDGMGQELFARQAVDRRIDDLEALAFGIQMEEKAIDLYSQSVKTATDPRARKAYEFLVEEETRHYHQLRDRWEALAGMAFKE
ncbi:MAG: ferritin family protein [Anaerolineae bacterium]|jgi:rubrerythrin